MVVRCALKLRPFWAHAGGTRRGLRSNRTNCVRKLKIAGGYFKIEAMVRGYHQYKEIWNASISKGLECQRETNPHDVIAEPCKRGRPGFYIVQYSARNRRSLAS